jgi:hypothetical protein
VGNWIEIPAYLEPASTTTTTSTSTSTTTTTSTSTSTTTTTTTAAPVYAIYAASPSQSEVCSGQGVGINTGIPSGSTLANTSIIYADFLTAGYFGGQTTFYRFDDGGTPYTREFYINMSVTSADPMGPAVPC